MFSGKWLVVITVAVGGTILVAYSGLRDSEPVTLTDAPRRPSRPIPDVCYTDGCMVSARYLQRAINTSVDPCDDFYQFACGRYISDNPVRPDEGVTSHSLNMEHIDYSQSEYQRIMTDDIDASDPGPVNSAKLFYKSCMDSEQREQEGIQPLVDLTNEFGGWPILSDQWEGDNLTTSEILQMTQRWLVSPFTQFLSTQYVRKLGRKIFVKVESTSSNHNLMVTQRDKYELSIKKHVALFMNESEFIRLAEQIEEDVDQIVEFESALYNISQRSSKTPWILPVKLTFKQLKVWCEKQDLMNITPSDWSSLLSSVLSNVGVAKYDVKDVVFEKIRFLLELVQLLSNTPRRVIANTMHWRIVQRMVLHTNRVEEVKDYNYDLKDDKTNIIAGLKGEKNKYCEMLIKDNLKHAIAYKFVRMHYTSVAKTFVDQVVKNVRSAFNSRIRNADWIDDENKALAIEKADSMKMFIGYPEWYDKPSALENYYEGLNCTDNYFKNRINLQHVANLRMLRDTFSPSGKLKPDDDYAAYELRATYSNKNLVHITAGHLLPPFFIAEGNKAVNYGLAGSVVGHEISHGFDVGGSQFDTSGKKRIWWNQSINQSYAEKTDCLRRQYDSYRIPLLDEIMKKEVTINGWNTLGENMADNSGVSTAFLAYQEYVKQNSPEPRLPGLEEYTPEQLFFIGYGTNWCASETVNSLRAALNEGANHSPFEARVMVPLFNSEDFAREFKCPVGSRMNPEEKCLLW